MDTISYSYLNSTGNMQSHTPIPPPRLPPPRPALQDVTTKANRSPVALPPLSKNASRGKQSIGNDYWERQQARARGEAESLRNAYQQTAVDVGRRAPPPVASRNPFSQSVPPTRGDLATDRSLARIQHAPDARPTAAAASPAASTGKKRKSETSSDEDIAAYKQNLDHIKVNNMKLDLSCNAVRSLINKVIERGIFKKGEFCNTIGCSPTAVNRFLEKTGLTGGIDSDVYDRAWAWFKQRELAGLTMPADTPSASKKKAKITATRPSTADLNSIHLPGEETDSVPVFETCDVIRRKITAHLKTPGMTQAQFCRDLHAQLKMPGCKSIQSKMLNDFRGKKGAVAGCTSSVYYAAYVYFEKLRIAEGKPKSKHRLEMEKIYPQGAERERDGRHGYWARADETIVQDEYGRVSVLRR